MTLYNQTAVATKLGITQEYLCRLTQARKLSKPSQMIGSKRAAYTDDDLKRLKTEFADLRKLAAERRREGQLRRWNNEVGMG